MFLKFVFFTLFTVKIYFFYFETIYILKYELFYNIPYFIEVLLFFFISSYFLYLTKMLFPNYGNPMFLFTVNTILFFSFIKKFGFLNFIKQKFLIIKKKYFLMKRRYFAFRWKLAKFTYSNFYKTTSIYSTKIKDHEMFEEFLKKQRHAYWWSKYDQSKNTSTHQEVLKKRKKKKAEQTSNPKNSSDESTKHQNFDQKTTKSKIFKKTKTHKKTKNKKKQFETTFFKYVSKLPNNYILKMLLNFMKILFLILDIIIVTLDNFFILFAFFKWKPLNVRLPYHKKIAYLKKNKKKWNNKK